jgi:hypothetical protein
MPIYPPDLHVSPSQLDTWNGCNRRWAADKILGYRSPDTPATDFGRLVHACGENWSRDATPPDLMSEAGKVFRPALVQIPGPKLDGVIPEREVHWTSPGGVPWLFLKDLEGVGWGQSGDPPVLQSRTGHVTIWDYKTFSRPEFNKTPHDLIHTNPQGIVYAAHAFLERQAETVQLRWLYLAKVGAKRCLPVIADPVKSECLNRFSLLEQTAHVMLGHRVARTNPLELAPDPKYCRAFGKECPYAGPCNPTPEERLRAIMTQTVPTPNPGANLAFLADIRARAAGHQPTVVATPAQAVVVQPPAPPPTVVVADPPRALKPWERAAATPTQVIPIATPAQLAEAATAPTMSGTDGDTTVTAAKLADGSIVVTGIEVALPAPAKRHRRTKAEMTAARAAGEVPVAGEVASDVVDPELADLPPDPPEEKQRVTQLQESDPDLELTILKETVACRVNGYDERMIVQEGPIVGLTFRERLILRMVGNPGHAASPAADLVNRADSIIGMMGTD